MAYKRGLKPILPGRLRPKLSRYFHPLGPQLPTPPTVFAHGANIPDDGWGMDGNDSVGDCFFAAVVHEDLATRSDNNMPGDEPLDALELYAGCTGYDPARPDTDQGTDPIEGFSWLVKQGVILAWAEIDQPALILPAMWAFGGLILGCAMPDDSDDQFEAGGPFAVTPTTRFPAYVDHATYQRAKGRITTWGGDVGMTPEWEAQGVRNRFVMVLPDLAGSNGLTECGLALDALVTDCAALARMV